MPTHNRKEHADKHIHMYRQAVNIVRLREKKYKNQVKHDENAPKTQKSNLSIDQYETHNSLLGISLQIIK